MPSLNRKHSFFTARSPASILFVLSFLLAACGGSTATPGGGGGEATSAPTAAPGAGGGSGLCASDFYPVVMGATWTYSGTGPTGAFSWTSTITDVSETSFTLTNQFDELVTTQQWSCTAQGLAALQYGSGPEATLSATGVSGVFETTDTSGVSFPVHVSAGDTWEQSFTIHGDMQIADEITASADGDVIQSYVAVGIEPITVSAGSFDAMKIDTTITFDLVINMGEGLTVPMNFSSVTTNWWVAGVGWVKSDSSATIEGGEPIVALTELQSFSIP